MMDHRKEFAPEVREILAGARTRGGSGEQVAVDARPLDDALESARQHGQAPIIGEVKPTSPTTDGARETDPVELAEEMVAGGVAAVSVLTEPDHFGGSEESLRRVREAVDVPVLRKDFLLEEGHLDAVHADAVLLIARFVDDLSGLLEAARERGFQVLVEVHTQTEFESAVDAGADFVGINNRDLAQLTVDLSTFEEVAPAAPPDLTLIAESGISTASDVTRMMAAGADGLLVGSALMDGNARANAKHLTEAQ
jgi:indole-3-glycerol phosphate synthase